jgi:diaminopimelate epimerase
MELTFYKYQGAGNDFVICDNRTNIIQLTAKQINHLCDRKFGIGADGFMLLQNADGYDFEMKYYNADGNEGSMCGNGGRCLVKFAYDCGIQLSTYHFLAIDGIHKAEMIEQKNWVNLKMKNVHEVTQVNDNFILDTGSPHFVYPCSNVMAFDVVEEGKKIRYSKHFKENGINVNFVEQKKEDTIIVRTYERGVEDETLSCGTGVTASALVFAHNQNGFNHIDVITKGGNLAVEFNKLNDQTFENIWLSGPAEFVFKGEIKL